MVGANVRGTWAKDIRCFIDCCRRDTVQMNEALKRELIGKEDDLIKGRGLSLLH